MDVSGETMRADKIFLFSGSRPSIPPIDGINETEYYTNRNIFEINEKPESMIVIGGGYVACKLAHFFSAVGTDVTMLEQLPRILPNHDPDISGLLEEKLSTRMSVLTNHRVVEIGERNGEKYARAQDTGSGENTKEDLYWGSEAPIWNNNGDTAYLIDPDDVVVDEESWS